MSAAATSFEGASVPPLGGSTLSLPREWDRLRDQGIRPRYLSDVGEDDEARLDFLEGARLIGLLESLKPQQLLLADVLSTPKRRFAVEMPRRAAKTTTIFALLLGRCVRRAGYKVVLTAQTGSAARLLFRDFINAITANSPDLIEEETPWGSRKKQPSRSARHLALFGHDVLEPEEPAVMPTRLRLLRGNSLTRIECLHNGSTFTVLPPDPAAFRGQASDVAWIDEGQEIDPLISEDIAAAILPLQDTRPGASIIVSGTAGESRQGLFWEYLQRGRAGDDRTGIVDFTAGDYSLEDGEPIDWDQVEDEATAMRLLMENHPGVGSPGFDGRTLTTLDTMRENYLDPAMSLPKWAREYLLIWPLAAGSAAIPAQLWAQAEVPRTWIPSRVAFGLDIKPGGGVATIAAAWREPDGTAYVEIVDHRQGTRWIGDRAQQLSSKYAGSTIAYDDIQEGRATATELLILRPRPRIQIQTYRDHAAGCVQLLRDLQDGTLRHFGQAGLNSAVQDATKRDVRGERSIWLWTTGPNGGDITPLVAATRALRNWDQHFAGKAQTRGVILTAS